MSALMFVRLDGRKKENAVVKNELSVTWNNYKLSILMSKTGKKLEDLKNLSESLKSISSSLSSSCDKAAAWLWSWVEPKSPLF